MLLHSSDSNMKKLRAYLLYIICIGWGWSCTRQPASSDNSKEHSRQIITVSIEPLRYLTEQIAGNVFQVVTFVPKGSNPETYEPTPEQMAKLGNSVMYFGISDLGFERTWLDRLVQTAPEVTFIDVTEKIRRMQGHFHGNNSSHQHGTDPHVWTSPTNMQLIAQHICTALSKADTVHAESFRENLRKVQDDIQTVDDSIQHLLAGTSIRTFLIYHPTLTYYAHDYGLEQLAIENDGKEPSPRHLTDLINQCKEKQVKTVFVQQEFDRKNAELIAKETGTDITYINPLAYDWKQEMLKIAQTLHEQ